MALEALMERLTGGSDGSGTPDQQLSLSSAPDDLSGLEGSEANDALPPDPKPSRRKPKPPLASGGSNKVTVGQKKQVRDALLLLLTPTTGFLAMRDPHCGGAAFAQREEIAAAMAPIICRNPAMLRWFTAADAPWLDYLALLTALQPVGQAIWSHHVRRAPADQQYGGEAVDYSGYSVD